MAALDTKTQFKLSTGIISSAHIIATGGDVILYVAVEHWLVSTLLRLRLTLKSNASTSLRAYSIGTKSQPQTTAK